MGRRVTPHRQFTSPTWGPPSACKQAFGNTIFAYSLGSHFHPKRRFCEVLTWVEEGKKLRKLI